MALIRFAFLKNEEKISSALACTYPGHGSVPFLRVCFQRTCSVHVNTHAGNSAQDGEANTEKGCS